mmetsp:Transcript_40415/g.116810  ORF Transcript_40415/g.116810 Transcript_40415/m.116810 type:complete len:340 (+) Transcript_40415:93-1112(+)|eukprot:CAMPEP_0170226006 /NCGR_PEP_ID=MMETSP0116_2-20130129/12713_1 /TAXON_ID=400756 /ORGANISM="Durinskia baltica, Strain CSIRO CS-38" /LENGTH=339 /DNA_ID=CAMNT_0010476729 /DNA_START=93 /DNA_END=1112 /DNA_ORIENTATION=-
MILRLTSQPGGDDVFRLVAALLVSASQAMTAAPVASAPFVEHEARVFASLAQAAYCGKNDEFAAALSRWDCGPCVDSGVGVVPGSVRVIETEDRHKDNATVTYVARLSADGPFGDACLLSVRGTTNVANWVRNFQFWKEDIAVPNCNGCRVEFGFATIWEEVRPVVLDALREVGCLPNGEVSGDNAKATTSAVYVTGHSMGAAVSTMAMMTLHTLGYTVLPTYLFESPRVGNQAFVDAFMGIFNQSRPVWRVTFAKDPVPSLPPRALGYRHVPYEVHYDTDGSYRPCEFPLDPMCSEHLVDDLHHIQDHCTSPLTPPGNICGCYLNPGEVGPAQKTILV